MKKKAYISGKITGMEERAKELFEQAEKEVRDQLNAFLNANGTHPVDYYHKKLGKIMWNKCGMSRNICWLRDEPSLCLDLLN